jgi:hypothetical protein
VKFSSIATEVNRPATIPQNFFSTDCLSSLHGPCLHWQPALQTLPENREKAFLSLFFCIENDWQLEPMPLSLHGNQHLIAWIS